jgi:DNA polymerase elongation subunit (family B)
MVDPNTSNSKSKGIMSRLQVEDDALNQELEGSQGDYIKMKTVFEKRIQLYTRYLKKEGLREMDRLRLENKNEWSTSDLLSLIVKEETVDKFSELTKPIYRLEKKTAELPEY